MKKRFSEEQIVGILREAEAGVAIKELCRKHGFSESGYYASPRKYSGMDVTEPKRLKSLEAENARLKRLLAETLLENEVKREALRKTAKRTGPSGHGAVDAHEGVVATPGARGGSNECDGATLSIATRSQYGVAHIDRGACPASSSFLYEGDLPQAASTWAVRELQAG